MLEGLKPPTRQLPCRVATILEQLSKEDQVILQSAIADAFNWPTKTLAKELKKRGLDISDTPIYKHRAKGCSCA